MIPITRKDLYLNKIVGNDDYDIPEKPISEEELFFAEILGEAVQAPEPLPRYQMYLAKIAGCEIEIPYPETRLEYFLARAAGMNVETPAPITKEEIYWSNYTAVMEFEIENVPPLAYKAIEGTLKDYRIYGNTVNGDSVGDRTANLFDGIIGVDNKIIGETGGTTPNNEYAISEYIPVEPNMSYTYHFYHNNIAENRKTYSITEYDRNKNIIHLMTLQHITEKRDYVIIFTTRSDTAYIRINWKKTYDEDLMLNEGSTALPYEPYGYRVPVTVEGKNLLPTNIEWFRNNQADPSKHVDFSTDRIKTDLIPINANKSILKISGLPNGINFVTYRYYSDSASTAQISNNSTGIIPLGAKYVSVLLGGTNFDDKTKILLQNSPIQLEYGSTATPYEPYQAPITTNLYLPEQIKMVGDEAEYVDYGQQKQHFADGTSTDVLLPALPTFSGTNTLSVNTEVQPSKVYIKGEKEREYS